jgi:putative ABC transport system ATP-binding protein
VASESNSPSTASDSIIQAHNVNKTYYIGELPVAALRDVSIEIKPREFVAIMGPSGSGKSTFMNLIGCLDRPDSGSILLDGEELASLDRDARAHIRNCKIGFVFQSFNLLPRTSVLENVELPMLYAGVESHERRHRSLEALTQVGLAGKLHNQSTQLSGGEQQRVAIARSLVNQPVLILADEPTGNLDTRTSVEIIAIFQQLNRDRRISVVLVTHEPDIAAFASRQVRFRDGRIVTDELNPQPRSAAEELKRLARVEPVPT